MSRTKFATIYNVTDERSISFGTENNEPSLTQQSDAQEADINVLMARFGQSGQLSQVIEPGQYGDFTEAPDFRRAQEILLEAREAFGNVDAKIRKRFDNDPAQFFAFVNDENNIDELRRMGLAKPVPEDEEIEINRYQQRPQPRYDDDGEHIDPSPEEKHNGKRQSEHPRSDRLGRPSERPGSSSSPGVPERRGER